jgi:hypothetical protein
MFHTILKIFKKSSALIINLLLSSLVFLQGCSLFEKTSTSKNAVLFKQKVFYSEYEKVWRASQLALTSYPIAVNNIDTGVLETEIIKGYEVWIPPHQKSSPSAGQRYKLVLNIQKGKTDSLDSVRVTISKKIQIQTDFFSDPKPLDSDGLEETVVLYRIDRELSIERGLEKSSR